MELVGTRLGDGVDAAADEVGLTDVEGGNHDLNFFKSVHGDGGATTREVAAQTEVVVEVGTINSEVGGTTVATSKAHTVCVG